MYGIKKHVKGEFYDNDRLILTKDYKVVKYQYKESASFMANFLTYKDNNAKYYVVRLNDD